MTEKSSLKQRVALWQSRTDEHEQKQHTNVFSEKFTGDKIFSHDEYGHPVEGTLTAQRGVQAAEWVDHEVDKLIEEIQQIGTIDSQGRVTCTFGQIFTHYVDISNTVVGILMRARKRKRIHYEGEMLFQNKSEDVVIVVL